MMKSRFNLFIFLFLGVGNFYSQKKQCEIADTLYNLSSYNRIMFEDIFGKFFEDDDHFVTHQMDSIRKIIEKKGLKRVGEKKVEIDKQFYQVYLFKFSSKRKRDVFLNKFDQHLLRYENYWILELFLKSGLFVVEKRRREIVVFRSNNPNIIIQFQGCFKDKQGFFLNNTILG